MSYLNIFIFLGIILIPCIIILELFIRSSRWFHNREQVQDSELPKGSVPSRVTEELGNLNLPQEKIEEAARKVTQIVHTEVQAQSQKIREEVKSSYEKIIKSYDKIIENKEKTLESTKKEFEHIQQNYKTLGKEKKQTESVVKSIAKGLIVINDQGEVVFVNPVAEGILGVKADKILGKSINNADGEHVISLVDEDGSEDRNFKDKNNEAKEMLKESTAIIQGPSGQTKGVVSILAGTAQKKKIDEYKTEFLANITHELRSPLICILKSIAIIHKELEHASEEHKNYLKIALRNAERLEKLVNDILDISKMEAGKMPLRYEIISATALLQDIRNMFSVWSRDKNMVIEEKIEDGVIFEADPERLRQVIVNLTANALKFTPRGGKIVLEAARREENGETRIEIGVRDNGPGLSEEDRKNLFHKFSSGLHSDGDRGTGLGLTIAKEIVELHKGRIWAENNKTRGAYFGFSIPKHPASSIYGSNPPQPQEAAPAQSPKAA